jgi:endonuclease YncB( thermonuclease family)
MLSRIVLLCILFAGTPSVADVSTPLLAGTVVKVIDGDTIDVQLKSGRIRVRLFAIDTPEMNQPWGKQARAALVAMVDRRAIELEPFQQDRYNRMIAGVFIGSRNINAELVRKGHAWAYRRYMIAQVSDLCSYEDAARRAKLGLWGLSKAQIIAPWEWRHRHSKLFTDYSAESAQMCVVEMSRR